VPPPWIRGAGWQGSCRRTIDVPQAARSPSAARPRLPAPVRSESHRCQRITVSALIIASAARTSANRTEADENQPIGPAEGRPRWPCPPQNIDLLAQHRHGREGHNWGGRCPPTHRGSFVKAFRALVHSVTVHPNGPRKGFQVEVKGKLAALIGGDAFPKAVCSGGRLVRRAATTNPPTR